MARTPLGLGRPDLPAAGEFTVTGEDVLFVHRRVDGERLAEAVPEPLSLHRIDGDPWVSVLTQEVTGAAPGGASLPSVPSFPQLNVRTYVEVDGRVGVYFLRLLAGSRLGAAVGRLAFGLPFEAGALSLSRRGETVTFRSRARDGPLRFDARYRPSGPADRIDSGTVLASLTERDRFFVPDGPSALVGRVGRDPWRVAPCAAEAPTNTVYRALGVDPVGDPLVRYSPGYEFTVGPPSRIGSRGRPG